MLYEISPEMALTGFLLGILLRLLAEHGDD